MQYWRSKSPATPICQTCGRVIIPVPTEDIQVLVNQGVKPEDMGLRAAASIHGDIEMEDAETAHFNNGGIPDFKLFESQPLSPIHITTYYSSNNSTTPVTTRNGSGFAAPKPVNERKRKLLAAEQQQQQPGSSSGTKNSEVTITPMPSTSAAAGPTSISTDKSDNSNNKIRRVQNKIRSQYNNNSGNVNKEMMSASTTGPSNVVIAGNNNKTRGK